MRKAKITESDAGTVTAPSPSGVGVTKIAAAIVTFVTNTVFWNSGIWLKTRIYKDLRVHAGVMKLVNIGDLKSPGLRPLRGQVPPSAFPKLFFGCST